MINARELTDEETKTLKKKAAEILSVCRRDVLTKYPFIGSIALRMEMVPVRDVRVRTACTDGNSVYFDIAFLSSLSRDEQTFVLAHEVWHAVMMHLVRRHNRDPQLFNIATDKEVNNLLSKDGFTAPSMVLMPTEEEEGKSAEEIYEMLVKKMKKQNQSGNGNSQSSSSNGKSKSSNGSNSQNGNSNGGNQPSKNGKKDGHETGELSGQFDKHIYEGEEDSQQNGNSGQNKQNGKNKQNGQNGQQNGNGDGDGNGQSSYGEITDKYGKVGFDSDYQPKVSKDFADKMRETIVSEAQRCEKMKGNLPAHIKELVKKCMTPEIRWQEVLAQFVTRCYNSGTRSWIPPNRRHVHNGVYLQSRQAQKLKAVLVIDTSGSTCGDRTIFLGELNSLINSFGMYELTVICADAEVASCNTYTQDDPLDIEHEGFEMAGGGGTSFVHPFNYVLDNQIACDVFIYLTDGYGDAPPKNPLGVPVLWVITKDGTEDFCDWGQKIRLNHTDNDYE